MAHAWMPEAMRIRAEADGGALGGGAPRVGLAHPRQPGQRGLGAVGRAAAGGRAPSLPPGLEPDDRGDRAADLGAAGRPRARRARPARLDAGPDSPTAGERERRGPGLRADRGARARGRAVHQRPDDRRRGDHELARLLGRSAPLAGGPARRLGRRRPDGRRAGVALSAAGGGGVGVGGAVGGAEGSRAVWARGGHFGASQVPGCAHVGPGAIDIHRLTGSGPHGLAVRTPGAAVAVRRRRAADPGLNERSRVGQGPVGYGACRLRQRQVGQVAFGGGGVGDRGDGEVAAGRRSYGPVRDDGFCL